MNLHSAYKMLKEGSINTQQAAESFGIAPESLELRIQRWGNRLPTLLKTLDALRNDRITTNEASERLQVTPRQVNHLMNSWKVTRPVKKYLVKRAECSVKWDIRKKYAIDIIANSETFEGASEKVEVTPRQMRRWVAGLLDKHFGIVYKDLAEMTDHKRRRLAEEIETAEGLELAKQQTLEAVAQGKKEIGEEALARIMSRRTRRTNRG